MPIMGDFAATFVNTELMNPTHMNEVFFNSDGDGIYDVIHTLECRDIDKVNFTSDLGVSVFMPERLFQFIPFPGAGGHTHDPSPPTTTPMGSTLANDSVLTANIIRSQCSLVYTGKPLVVFNKGTVAVQVASRTSGASAGLFGHGDFDTTVDGDYTANLHTWESNQVPVCIATHRAHLPSRSVSVYAEPITPPNRWRIHVAVADLIGTYNVDWMVIGIRA